MLRYPQDGASGARTQRQRRLDHRPAPRASGARAEVPLVDLSEARTKINPLANWTWGDVWHYIQQNNVAYNPLHDQFFPSIGCEPCTRAISQGEDFRSGRWWWEDESAKECGLHVTQIGQHVKNTTSEEKATA